MTPERVAEIEAANPTARLSTLALIFESIDDFFTKSGVPLSADQKAVLREAMTEAGVSS